MRAYFQIYYKVTQDNYTLTAVSSRPLHQEWESQGNGSENGIVPEWKWELLHGNGTELAWKPIKSSHRPIHCVGVVWPTHITSNCAQCVFKAQFRVPDPTQLNSTDIKQFAASRQVLNIFRTSWVELSRVGRSELDKNCWKLVVTQFAVTDQ